MGRVAPRQKGEKAVKSISSQVRIPENLHEYITKKADKLGISKNAFLVILLDRGKKYWEAEINLLPQEQPPHAPSHNS